MKDNILVIRSGQKITFINAVENLITNNLGNYHFCIVMPHFNEDISAIVRQIPKDKLLILDIDVEQLEDNYAVLYQNFEQNFYQGLTQALPLLEKYQSLILYLSKNHFQYTPKGILEGFNQFCCEHNMSHRVIYQLYFEQLKKGNAYILSLENDLIQFVNYANQEGLILGDNIRLMSYDDTPIKANLVQYGITTLSNDFVEMGKLAGKMVRNKQKGKVPSECNLIIRGSL